MTEWGVSPGAEALRLETQRKVRPQGAPPLHALKYPGGKLKLAEVIISFFPVHRIYVEPFGGGGAVLLNKPRSEIEVYNDINGDIVNFFKVLRDEPDELIEFLQKTPYAREIYTEAGKWLNKKRAEKERNGVLWAAYTFIVYNASFGGCGRKSSWAFSRMTNHAKGYYSKIDKLYLLAERFKGVYIDNLDFEKVIKNWDSEETLFYLDPPYYKAEGYYNKKDEFLHYRLARTLREIKGLFILSYNDAQVIRELYEKYNIYEVKRKLALNKKIGEERDTYNELIITNFDPNALPPFISAEQHTLLDFAVEVMP